MTHQNKENLSKQAAAVMAMAAMPGRYSRLRKNERKVFRIENVSQIKVDDQWDVIIVGGGPAGCTAAIAAAREGAKTFTNRSDGTVGRNGDSRNGSCLVSVFRW